MNRILLKDNGVITFDERPGLEFNIDKLIGKGSSCVVYHAVCSDNTEHLLKEYYPKLLEVNRDVTGEIVPSQKDQVAFEQGLKRFQNGCERQKTIRLSNEGLKNFTCNVQGYYKKNGTEYIDMTCFNGQTYDNVREQSVYNLALRMRTLTQVVGNYHKAGLLHLDIKPENIYVRPDNETVEDVMLFDFDSVVAMDDVRTSKALSCTKTWAAPEQLLSDKRKAICPATDLFAIGEILFVQLLGRHSTQAERRSFVKKYDYDYEADIFKDVNPKVFALLNELLSHTICNVVSKRYQSSDELITKLNEIIKIADPKEPYLKSSLPAVQNFFVGREDEIEEIHEKFSKNNILFLKGMGGIGKSELAKHYARTYEKDYDVIIFAPYLNDTSMLLQNDVSIPIHNFHKYPEETFEEYCVRKLRKLQELCDDRTLVIVDNLDSDEDENVSKLFGLQCKILITTRMDFSDYGYGQQLSLDAIKNRNEVRSIFDEYYTMTLTDEEDACVHKIIDLIAGHTMTVELLAKQMMAGRITPDKMLVKLQEGGLGGSRKELVRMGKDGIFAAQSAYAHIQTLFNLSEIKEYENYVLANLSLIPYTGISMELFYDLCELDDYKAINKLVVKGWINLEGNSISVHPLIAENILGSIESNSKIFNKLLSNILDTDNVRKDMALILKCLANRIMQTGIRSDEVANFITKVPSRFVAYGNINEAPKYLSYGLDIRLELHGDEHKSVEQSYYNLALIYTKSGEYRLAKDYYKKTLEKRRKRLDENHKLISNVYNGLCFVCIRLEEFSESKKYGFKALRIRRKLFGHTNDAIAKVYNNLGMLYRKLNKFEVAEKCYKNSLRIKEELFGSDSIKVTEIYHNLSFLYTKMGSFEKAEKFAQKALDIRIYNLDEDHISTATAYKNLGDIYKERKRLGSAKKCYEKSLQVYKVFYGEKNKKTLKLQEEISKLPYGPTMFEIRQESVKIKINGILEKVKAEKSLKNFSTERCPDQIVARIEVVKLDEIVQICMHKQCQVHGNSINNSNDFLRENIDIKEGKGGFKRVVLILESPHKDEFNIGNVSNPVNGPAYGKTGRNLNKFLAGILQRYASECGINEYEGFYDVILVNAVQFQCSLGENPRKHRDKTFWECWLCKDVRDDFMERVKKAINNFPENAIVINCCTKGGTSRSNQSLVNIVLEDMGLTFFESTHPSSWDKEINRSIKKHQKL